MGILATCCRLCGLPVSHEHYVPMGDRLGVFRDEPGNDVPPAVTFTPEHAWLADALALRRDASDAPAIVRGRVSNGVLRSEAAEVPVSSGRRAALHVACHELAGRPEVWAPKGYIPTAPELAKYTQQLFDFAALFADGQDGLLRDPRGASEEARRNRERILANAEIFSGARPSPVPKLTDLLRFLVTSGAEAIQLRPGAKPVVFVGDDEVDHPFQELPERAFFNTFLAVMTPAEMAKLREDGELVKTFGAKGLGWFRLDVYGDEQSEIAEFTRVEPPTMQVV